MSLPQDHPSSQRRRPSGTIPDDRTASIRARRERRKGLLGLLDPRCALQQGRHKEASRSSREALRSPRKAFDLIQRFSEEHQTSPYSVTTYRRSFPSDDELRAMDRTSADASFDEIKDRCSGYINGKFQAVLTKYAATELEGMKFKIRPRSGRPRRPVPALPLSYVHGFRRGLRPPRREDRVRSEVCARPA